MTDARLDFLQARQMSLLDTDDTLGPVAAWLLAEREWLTLQGHRVSGDAVVRGGVECTTGMVVSKDGVMSMAETLVATPVAENTRPATPPTLERSALRGLEDDGPGGRTTSPAVGSAEFGGWRGH